MANSNRGLVFPVNRVAFGTELIPLDSRALECIKLQDVKTFTNHKIPEAFTRESRKASV